MRKQIGAVVFALSLAMGQSAFAHMDHHCWAQQLKQMLSSLNLDDSQRSKIKSLREQARSTQKSNWEQLKSLRAQTHQLVQSENLDQSKLDSIINQKKDIIGNMMKTRITTKNQIYNVLNPQQKAKYQQMVKEMETKCMSEMENKSDSSDND